MKEQAIKKINTMGKIGHIIAIITKIALITGLVGIIIGGIVLAILPDDLVTATFKGTANINLNLGDLDLGFNDFSVNFSDKEKAEIQEDLLDDEDYDIEFNGMEFGITNANVEDSSINFDASADNIVFKLRDLCWILVVAGIAVIATFVLIIFIDKLCIAIRDCNSPFEENVIKKLENFAFSILGWSVVATLTKSVISSILTHKIEIMVGVDLGMLIMVLIILGIAYIFKYGAVLQQESDETL